jgi:hypothetical protein
MSFMAKATKAPKSAAARATAVKSASSKVKAKTSINFSRSVRGK